MKKTLLTFAAALTFGATFAQAPFIIWDGTSAGAAHGTPFKLGPATVKLDSFNLGTKVYYLDVSSVSTSYYAGGAGVATYSAPEVATPLGYTGSVANTTVKYIYSTFGSANPVTVRFDLKTTSGSTYGRESTLKTSTSATDFDTLSVPLSSFKLVNLSDGTFSTPLADTALALATSEVQLNASTKANSGEGAIAFKVAYLHFIQSAPLAIDDDLLTSNFNVFPNPNNTGVINLGENAKSYSLSTISGAVVKEGVGNTINVEGLEKGVYFVRVGNKTTKVVLN